MIVQDERTCFLMLHSLLWWNSSIFNKIKCFSIKSYLKAMKTFSLILSCLFFSSTFYFLNLFNSLKRSINFFFSFDWIKLAILVYHVFLCSWCNTMYQKYLCLFFSSKNLFFSTYNESKIALVFPFLEISPQQIFVHLLINRDQFMHFNGIKLISPLYNAKKSFVDYFNDEAWKSFPKDLYLKAIINFCFRRECCFY